MFAFHTINGMSPFIMSFTVDGEIQVTIFYMYTHESFGSNIVDNVS